MYTILTLLLAAAFSTAACGSGPECVHGNCTYGDGAYFCQCRRGWAGAACDAPRAGFRKIPADGQADSDRAINYACLVNGTECTDSKKCNYYAGAYSCDPCPDGFVSYDGECLPKSCFNSNDYNDREASKPPCNGRGRCLLKDPGMAGLEAGDYACDCYPIYRGALCESCNDANAIAVSNTPSSTLPTCNARACQDADGVVCSGHGKCVLDVGLDRESYHYRCNCESEYTRVGHKCVKKECVATVDGSPVVCGGFGECTEEGEGAPKCTCDKDAVQVGKFCTYSACTDESRSKICGGVGACVRDGAAYSCDCRGLASGKLCDTCDTKKSVSINGECVPLGCLTSNKQDLCTPTGTCVKSDGAYHCRCPDMLVAVDGKCTSPACMDEELGLVCSGHGECTISNLQDIKCTCSIGYTYVPPGRCILNALTDGVKVCENHGRVVISNDASSTMTCQCSFIYTGTACAECNTANAKEIDGECIATKCIVPTNSIKSAAADTICETGDKYTTFGDSSNPFITCIPSVSKDGNVSAYNGTFSAKPGCVHVSKIDRKRRFFCGFLEGLTDSLQTDRMPICAKPSDKPNAAEMCTTCPAGFNLVYFTEHNRTCMHADCRNKNANTNMWYDYCGGSGDCIKRADGQEGYECDCGTGATWDEGSSACITNVCMLNKSLSGPVAPKYCVSSSSNFGLQCVVGRDATWQCECSGETYLTYNKTCILKSKNANPMTQRARGLCGGPGAGYLDTTGTCVCNEGFKKIGDMCYSYDCLPVGATATTSLSVNKHVCSGRGVCTYNQLTGRYGCECESDFEAFGGYCSHPGCVSKVFYNGEVKYIECKTYDSVVAACAKASGETTYSCNCGSWTKLPSGICVSPRCMSSEKYCGGDLLASCIRGSDNYYGCVCSEGYERGQSNNECIPSKCVYRKALGDPAVACNGLGTCSEANLLKDRVCTCNPGASAHTLRDASGELRTTCILDACISSETGVEPPVICGGLGRCGPSGCICDLGTKLFGKVCVGVNCFINTTDDSGKITESICGGETVGVCAKVESFGDRRDYACKCKEPAPEGYEEVDGFCLPKSCIVAITMSDNTQKDTMCGGKHLGTCVLNATSTATPYCKCITRSDVVQLDNKKCMKRVCLSDVLPGDTFRNVECSSHGKCKTGDSINYACDCEQGYKTVKGVLGTYLCIPQACVVSETDTAMVCSGKGTCSFNDNRCNCHTGYTGTTCGECASNYKKHNNVCYPNDCPQDDNCNSDNDSNTGECRLINNRFACSCISNFVVDAITKKCRKSYCVWTDPYDHIEKTCYGMGVCNDNGETTGKCSCNLGTTLVDTNICVYSECISTDESNSKTICKGRGVCTEGTTGTGICRCDSSKYRTDKKSGQCFAKDCFGAHESILSEVCDGGGECNEVGETGTCTCNKEGFENLSGQNGCVHTNCISSDKKLCSGFGACENTNGNYRCSCASHYTLVKKDCIPTRCLGSGGLCNGGGECSGKGASATCRCNSGWASHGALCYPAACVSNGLICGGNGRCVFENGVTPTCVCNEGFTLTDDFICGVPVSSNKSSAGTTIAIVVVVLLVLAAVAGFLVWQFVIRPRKGGALRERAPRKDASLTRSRSLKRQAASNASLHADAPLLSQLSNANSSIQL